MKQKIQRILGLTAMVILVFIGLSPKKSNNHTCPFGKVCPFYGRTSCDNGCGLCEKGSECRTRDSIHFQHPDWSYEQCQVEVKKVRGSLLSEIKSTQYENANSRGGGNLVVDTIRILPKRKKGHAR